MGYYYIEPAVITDLKLIDYIVNSDDFVAKSYVVDNPLLTDKQRKILSNDASVDVRRELAKSAGLSQELLKTLSKDKVEEVRLASLCNPLTTVEDLEEALLNTKISAEGKAQISRSDNAVRSFKIFSYLWDSSKQFPRLLIYSLNYALWQNTTVVDENIFPYVHGELQNDKYSNSIREAYAEAHMLALPEILDSMKDDPHRPIINAISRNGRAWPATHEYLAGKHKTSLIRTNIATVTQDNDLLNKIYHGTKSKDIRSYVEDNPIFVLQEVK